MGKKTPHQQGAMTAKERHGQDFHSRIARRANHHGRRGHYSRLKTEEGYASNIAKSFWENATPEEKAERGRKIWETRRAKYGHSGLRKTVDKSP